MKSLIRKVEHLVQSVIEREGYKRKRPSPMWVDVLRKDIERRGQDVGVVAEEMLGLYEKGLRDSKGFYQPCISPETWQESGEELRKDVDWIMLGLPKELFRKLGYSERVKDLESLAEERLGEAEKKTLVATERILDSKLYGESWKKAAELYRSGDTIGALKAFFEHKEPFLYCKDPDRDSQWPDFAAPVGFSEIVQSLEGTSEHERLKPVLDQIERFDVRRMEDISLSAVSSSRGVPHEGCHMIQKRYMKDLSDDYFPQLKEIVESI